MEQVSFALYALQHPEARKDIAHHFDVLRQAYGPAVARIAAKPAIIPPSILEDTLAEYLLDTAPDDGMTQKQLFTAHPTA